MRRIIDHGAIFAGWVGLGMALVIAIAFELIVAVQSVVFLIAPLAGVLIGTYANVRAERYRPWTRLLSNSAYAGLVTGLGLALMYAAIRLLFVFADSGYRVPAQGGQLSCAAGPECTYQRYVASGREADLAAVGVVDGGSFGAFVVREQATGALTLLLLTTGGAVLGGAARGVRAPSGSSDVQRRSSAPH